MNAENFSNYLKNPAQLYQLSYQELKSLVIQYPYCQNLRYLLLKKSRLENRKDFERNLHLAAAYSIDREFLYQQLKEEYIRKEVAENYSLAENYFYLKDLSTLEDILEQIPPTATAEGNVLENFIINLEDHVVAEESESPVAEEDLPESQDVDDLSLLERLAAEAELELGVFIEEEDTVRSLEELAPKAKEEAKPSSRRITKLDDLLEKDGVDDREKTPASLEDLVIDSVLSEMGRPQPENQKEVEHSEEKASVLSMDLMENLNAFGALLESFELPQEARGETVSRKPQDVPLEITNEEDLVSETENDFTQPEPKVAFSSWIEQFQSPKARLQFGELGKVPGKVKNKKRKKKNIPKHRDKKSKKAKLVARQSIVENEEIVSEPLAALLESQGHYQKAIAMYERLSLLFPEKSIFFAAKIEQLKEL